MIPFSAAGGPPAGRHGRRDHPIHDISELGGLRVGLRVRLWLRGAHLFTELASQCETAAAATGRGGTYSLSLSHSVGLDN
jgi:hypothetical protein